MKRKITDECLRIALKFNTRDLHPQWGNYHHFSFVIQDNKIIDWSTNRDGTPIIAIGYSHWQKIHSEFDAWRKAKGILNKRKPFEVVNIRLTKTNRVAPSYPCNCCYQFLKNVGCKGFMFSTNLGNFAYISY